MEYKEIQNAEAALINGYSNIYSLNGYQIKKDNSYYKYTKLKFLEEDLDKKQITFVSPLLWKEDSYEVRFYECGYHKLSPSFTEPHFFCLCLASKQTENEDAKWMRYGKGNDLIVKETIKMSELLSLLDGVTKIGQIDFYVGDAIYLDKEEIRKITRARGAFGDSNYFTNFTIEKYLSLFLLKRISFLYENEIRIFAIPKSSKFYEKNGILKLDAGVEDMSDIIGRITISPYCDNKTIPFDAEKEKQRLKKKYPGIQIVSSRMFEKCPKCKL